MNAASSLTNAERCVCWGGGGGDEFEVLWSHGTRSEFCISINGSCSQVGLRKEVWFSKTQVISNIR